MVVSNIFGCEYCAGVGYEDYPSRKIPCRIAGHLEAHLRNEDHTIAYFKANPLPKPKRGKPTGNWVWTGRGWQNLDYVKSIAV